MGQQPSTAGRGKRKPKKVSTDQSNFYDDDGDDEKKSNKQQGAGTTTTTSTAGGKTSTTATLQAKDELSRPPASNTPKQTLTPKQSPKDKGKGSAPVAAGPPTAAAFTSDASNPFCAPLDHVREEERPYYHLAEISHFDVPTIRRLHQIFNEISESGIDDGIIDASELTDAMGLDSDCLLARAIFRIFDITQTKKINFRTWITTLSALSDKASLEEKIKFSFSLYDLNADGTIDINELRQLLAAAVRENVLNLTEEQVQSVCDHTLQNVDRDGDGMVDYDEYRAVVSKSHKFIGSFTLDIPALVQSFRLGRYQQQRGGDQLPHSLSHSQSHQEDNVGGLSEEEQRLKQQLFKSRDKKHQSHNSSDSSTTATEHPAQSNSDTQTSTSQPSADNAAIKQALKQV